MSLRGWNPDTEIHKALQELRGLLNTMRQVIDAPDNVKGMIMALQKDVQALVDEMAKNTSATQSMKQAFDLQSSKINDQGTQIAALQKQITDLQSSGQPVDAEDLAAIQDSVSKVQANNTALGEITAAVSTAAPANVPTTPSTVIPGDGTSAGSAGNVPGNQPASPPAQGTVGTPGDTVVPPAGQAQATPAQSSSTTAPDTSAPGGPVNTTPGT